LPTSLLYDIIVDKKIFLVTCVKKLKMKIKKSIKNFFSGKYYQYTNDKDRKQKAIIGIAASLVIIVIFGIGVYHYFGGRPGKQPLRYTFYDTQKSLEAVSADELNLKESYGADFLSLKDKAIFLQPKDDWSKIINEVPAGKIIVLPEGNYAANFELEKGVEIIGRGDSTVIKSAKKGKPIFRIAGGNVKLQDMYLNDSDIGVTAESGTELTMRYVKIEHMQSTAIYTNGSKVNFQNIYVNNSNSAVKLKNTEGEITGSIIERNLRSGIEAYGSNIKIEGNEISENQSYGVYIDPASTAVIHRNFIEGNKGFNVRVEGEGKIFR